MNRWKVATVHFCLSLLIVGTIALLVFKLWFPIPGLYRVANLDKLFEVMLGIDVTIGPLLTSIVVYPGKSRGKILLDLSVIAFLQCAFLGYGLYTLWKSRPVFLVGSSESFALVFSSEVPNDATATAKHKGWQRLGRFGPWLVGVDLNQDKRRMQAFLDSYLVGEGGPLRDVSIYQPYAEVREQVIAGALREKDGRAADGLLNMSLLSQRAVAQMQFRESDGMPVRVLE